MATLKKVLSNAVVIPILLSIAPIGANAAFYTLTDLGTLPGDANSVAQGINAFGVVTGRSDSGVGPDGQAYRWQGSMTGLGTLGGAESTGWAISDDGTVVGNAQNASGQYRAFYDDGTMHDLGTLGGSDSYARDISNTGQIVGDAQTGSGSYHATLWSGGSVSDLGTLGGSGSYGMAINESGVTVGYSLLVGDASSEAFVWDQSNGMQGLGTLGGADSEAHDINDSGTIVGFSDAAGGQVRGFMYTSGGGMVDLGSLGGDEGSRAFAINNSGQIVGHSSYTSGMPMTHAFLYENGGIVDLNTLVVGASGWTLMEARDINDSGQIVGFAMFDGQVRGFLLTETTIDDPVPLPGTLWLLIGTLGVLVRRVHGA
ncbi:MAG: DUF3466 family protein [Gammaproteobacteria bacterium]|nr:DUF3466 family protein [Gammaproteobacteria bacterium]MCP5135955.1 DUF3466 family protein [Gammaproteobacteria bacterium]